MDLMPAKAVTPVSPSLPTNTDRTNSTATAAAAVVSPIVATPVPAYAPQADLQSQMQAIAAQLQEYLNSSRRDVEFRVDAGTGVQVVTVRDAATGDVVRQMPSEEVLRVLQNMNAAQGTLLNSSV